MYELWIIMSNSNKCRISIMGRINRVPSRMKTERHLYETSLDNIPRCRILFINNVIIFIY